MGGFWDVWLVHSMAIWRSAVYEDSRAWMMASSLWDVLKRIEGVIVLELQ
jgi:hypothetical protein